MEYNKERVSTVDDDPCEGKIFEFPQCTSCKHCSGNYCEAFQKLRLDLIAYKETDLFNCSKFESKW